MTQYFLIDESGDPGLDGSAGSSSHFVLAMVQLPNRAPLDSLAHVRKALGFPDTFEFKYHKTAFGPKDLFFSEVLSIPFRVRAVVVDKKQLIPTENGATLLAFHQLLQHPFLCQSERLLDRNQCKVQWFDAILKSPDSS